ncbi:MAG: DUF5615 family PIN-like protein [Anaerolineae bacterium]|nr:DUF5615 family PIN-like protein [Anaerolineae bacterium]
MVANLRFKVDENLPSEVAEHLRRAGYDAETVLTEHLGGSSDMAIAAICQREARTLITLDTGFTDIRTYPPDQYAGLIVLRLKRQDKRHVLAIVARLATKLSEESLVENASESEGSEEIYRVGSFLSRVSRCYRPDGE